MLPYTYIYIYILLNTPENQNGHTYIPNFISLSTFFLLCLYVHEQNMTDERRKKRAKKFEMKVQKFAQTTMEQLFYGSFTYFGLIMVLNQPWAWPSALWWKDFDKLDETGHSIHSYMTEAVAGFYIMYAARYFQGMLSVLMEHRRKDFWEMMVNMFENMHSHNAFFAVWQLLVCLYIFGPLIFSFKYAFLSHTSLS
jgi:hypothetical protein